MPTRDINLNDAVWSEAQLVELLNIKSSSLDNLRIYRGLPHVKVGRGRRVYLAESVLAWLAKGERVIGGGEAAGDE